MKRQIVRCGLSRLDPKNSSLLNFNSLTCIDHLLFVFSSVLDLFNIALENKRFLICAAQKLLKIAFK